MDTPSSTVDEVAGGRPSPPSHDDTRALHAVLDAAALAACTLWRLPWAASLARLARLAALPLALLAWPLARLAATVRILVAPALHVLAYLLSWARALAALPASLEVASPTLGLGAAPLTDRFGSPCTPLYAPLAPSPAVSRAAAFLLSLPLQFSIAAIIGVVSGVVLALSSSVITTYLDLHDDPDKHEPYSDKLARYRHPASEVDWYRTESSTSRLRQPSGLLSQTIHEEKDDSDL